MRLRVRDRRAIQLHGGYGKAPRGKLGRAEMTLPAKYLFASYSIVDSVCTGTHGRTALSRAGLDPTRAAVEEPRSGPDPPVGGSGRAGSVGCTGHLLPRLRLDCSNSFIRSRSVHPSMDALCVCVGPAFFVFFFFFWARLGAERRPGTTVRALAPTHRPLIQFTAQQPVSAEV